MKSAYRYFLSIPTRWKDNDIFGHINNVEYYSFVETIITTFLVREGGFDITAVQSSRFVRSHIAGVAPLGVGVDRHS